MNEKLEGFPVSENANKMLGYVTAGFYDKSYVGKWLFEVMGQEYDGTQQLVEDLPAQFFPETATWGLMYHEIKWGLPVSPNLTDEERRRQIYKKRDFKAPMTPYRMEEYLRLATDFEVHILDVHDGGQYGYKPEHPNIFKVVVTGDGTLDTEKVIQVLDKIKQSHTVYKIDDRVDIIIKNLLRFLLHNVKIQMNCTNASGISASAKVHFFVYGNTQQAGAASVVKRRNLWYLDGSEALDGTKLLNAMEVKEDL